jgi:hypothetical protein
VLGSLGKICGDNDFDGFGPGRDFLVGHVSPFVLGPFTRIVGVVFGARQNVGQRVVVIGRVRVAGPFGHGRAIAAWFVRFASPAAAASPAATSSFVAALLTLAAWFVAGSWGTFLDFVVVFDVRNLITFTTIGMSFAFGITIAGVFGPGIRAVGRLRCAGLVRPATAAAATAAAATAFVGRLLR